MNFHNQLCTHHLRHNLRFIPYIKWFVEFCQRPLPLALPTAWSRMLCRININKLHQVDCQAYQARQYTWVTVREELMPSLNSWWQEVTVNKDWNETEPLLPMPLFLIDLLHGEYDHNTFCLQETVYCFQYHPLRKRITFVTKFKYKCILHIHDWKPHSHYNQCIKFLSVYMWDLHWSIHIPMTDTWVISEMAI